MLTWSSLQSIGHSVGLMALLVLAYSHIVQFLASRPLCRQIAIGVLFSAGTMVSMLDPVVLAPGVLADLRMVTILLAGPFGGPWSVIVCGAAAAAFRIYEGGAGSLSGVASIVIAMPLSIAFARLAAEPHRLRVHHLVTLGLLSGFSFLSVLLLPASFRGPFLTGPAAPIFVATVLGVMLLGTLLTRELRRVHAEAEVARHALTDPLTQLPNRRALEQALAAAFHRARRHQEQLSVLFLDIDHFKRINDEFGHDAGDEALKEVARNLREAARADDFLGRYGGEEFVVLLSATPAIGGLRHAERLRQAVAGKPAVPSRGVSLTISVGVAALDSWMTEPGELLGLADLALLRAKAGGRNRVQVAGVSTAALRKAVRAMRGGLSEPAEEPHTARTG